MTTQITLPREVVEQLVQSLGHLLTMNEISPTEAPEFHQALTAGRAALATEQPYDQTALELCEVCGWKTLIPGDCCLNCERSKATEQVQPAQGELAYVVNELRETARVFNEKYDSSSTADLCNKAAAIQAYRDRLAAGVVLPEISPHDHPEPQTHVWTKLEIRAIQAYARQAIADALAKQVPQEWKQVPQGYKLVPVEPIAKMIAAARNSCSEYELDTAKVIYSAMLAAAPDPKEGA